VRRAVILDRFLAEEGLLAADTYQDAYRKARGLLDTVVSGRQPAENQNVDGTDTDDERIKWFSPWFKDTPSLEEHRKIGSKWRWKSSSLNLCVLLLGAG